MSDIRDFFIKTLDQAESGINGMMSRLFRKIREADPQVEARLVDQDLKPQYFSFRYGRLSSVLNPRLSNFKLL